MAAGVGQLQDVGNDLSRMVVGVVRTQEEVGVAEQLQESVVLSQGVDGQLQEVGDADEPHELAVLKWEDGVGGQQLEKKIVFGGQLQESLVLLNEVVGLRQKVVAAGGQMQEPVVLFQEGGCLLQVVGVED